MLARSASQSWRQWWRMFPGTAATWGTILCLVFGASSSCGYSRQRDKGSYPRCKFMPARFFRTQSFLRAQADNFTQEIAKHIMVAPFSCLELHLTAKGHAYGGFVFHLLGMDKIRAATRRLKLILNRSAMEGGCPLHCPCGFRNWRFETVSLPALEEVEFNRFQGEDHEFDLLQLILGCAPMLKRMIVHLSK